MVSGNTTLLMLSLSKHEPAAPAADDIAAEKEERQ